MATVADLQQMAERVALQLILKSGVREWSDADTRLLIADAALEIAARILGLDGELDVTLPDFVRATAGTPKTLKSSSGDAAITLASLANGNGTSTGARQSATLDLGASWDRDWVMTCEYELAATPTAGNTINHYASFYGTTNAGLGNTSGSDASYTGYSNNIDAAAKHLEFIGSFICTAQATSTVQKGLVGVFRPKGRYMNLVVDNRSGAAFHSSDSNCVIRLTPLVEGIVDTITGDLNA